MLSLRQLHAFSLSWIVSESSQSSVYSHNHATFPAANLANTESLAQRQDPAVTPFCNLRELFTNFGSVLRHAGDTA